jgi:hypothetical protein
MTNNKQQTTLEWFAFELSKLGLLPDGVPDDIYKQAKEMEKERMKGMYVEGSFAKMRYYDGLEYIDAEQYYNETYGGVEQ